MEDCKCPEHPKRSQKPSGSWYLSFSSVISTLVQLAIGYNEEFGSQGYLGH